MMARGWVTIMNEPPADGPEDVRSSLPYVEIVTPAEYRCEGVLIDDERILGTKVRFESLCRYPCDSCILVVITFHAL